MKQGNRPAQHANLGFRPGRAWSLLEMMNFSFFNAHTLLEILQIEQDKIARWIAGSPPAHALAGPPKNTLNQLGALAQTLITGATTVPDSEKEDMKKILGWVGDLANELTLSTVTERIEVFAGKMRWSMTLHDYMAEIRVVRESLLNGLRNRHFYAYPEAKFQVLRDHAKDWSAIITAFKETKDESRWALDCYAMGLDTASVFHSMRVAEHGLRAVAHERRVKLPRDKEIDWGTWTEILKALQDESELIGKTKKAGKAKDKALAFYSGAVSDLNAFRDEYRNLVMHVRAKYDELQALRAIRRVHEFMGRLVEVGMDSRHHRIRWGFR